VTTAHDDTGRSRAVVASGDLRCDLPRDLAGVLRCDLPRDLAGVLRCDLAGVLRCDLAGVLRCDLPRRQVRSTRCRGPLGSSGARRWVS